MKPRTRITRRAIVPITEQLIENMIRLPASYTIHGLHANNEMLSIDLLVTSPDLDEVPEGAMPPRLIPTIIHLVETHDYRMMIIWDSKWEDSPIYDGVVNDLRAVS